MEVEINGVKYRAVTREEMREMDRAATEDYGIPGLILMENAGRGAAMRVVNAHHARKCTGPVLILCGKGNNGGDGFVIARHLHNAGLPVAVRYLGDATEIDPVSDAGVNCFIVLKMKLDFREIVAAKDIEDEVTACKESGILVDALMGTGLHGDVREPIAGIISLVNSARPYTIAVDTPSGLDCNTGRPLGCAVIADDTVTFGLPKVGFFKGEGPRHVGRLTVVEISLPRNRGQT